jgi:two-component system response regulator RegX3
MTQAGGDSGTAITRAAAKRIDAPSPRHAAPSATSPYPDTDTATQVGNEMRVLLVEDDPDIAASVRDGLQRRGYDVDLVDTGRAAITHAGDADVVLLDLGLPDIDGIDVCRELRGQSDVPIIVVSARDDELDRVVGLEVGADDYVVKPFGMRELIARIRAVARRAAHSPDASEDTALRLGELVVDPRTRRVTIADREVALTPKEFDLLAVLVAQPGTVLRREELLEEVWDMNWFGSTKTLDVHVASLRKKLGDPGWIETIRGVGFRAARVG